MFSYNYVLAQILQCNMLRLWIFVKPVEVLTVNQIVLLITAKKLGEPVKAGEPLYRLYAQFPADFRFARELCEQDNGYRIGSDDTVTRSFVEF